MLTFFKRTVVVNVTRSIGKGKGLEFKLEQDPISWTNKFPVFHSTKFSEINSAILFEDTSVYDPTILDLVDLASSNLLRLNYGSDININIMIAKFIDLTISGAFIDQRT